MFGKQYNNILEKIKILKDSGSNKKLEQFETQFEIFVARLHNKTEKEFNNFLSSNQTINKLNAIATEYPKKVQENYNKINVKIEVDIKENICKNCNTQMVIRNSRSICDICGYNELIQQIYYGELYTKKSNNKKDTVDVYCMEWLGFLQGKGIVNLPDEIFSKIVELGKKICNGNPRLVANIKCYNIRSWLSMLKATAYNRYVPAIHRRLTRELGFEIIPPQFNLEEEQIIISDWKFLSPTYGEEYRKLKNKKNNKRSNNPYYPICIFFIVKTRFGQARGNLLEPYIHKQSATTYFLRELSWYNTIEKLKYTGKGKYNI